MPKLATVLLDAEERARAADFLASGVAPARSLAHARILLKADAGPGGPARPDARIAEAVEVSPSTVSRVRKRWATGGFDDALHRRPTGPRPRRLDGAQEACLVALACSAPPDDRARGSLRLLADRLVELEVVDGVAPNTVRAVLKKAASSRG